MKIALSVIAGIVVLMLLAVAATAFNLITIPWLQFNSKVQTNRDIVTKTYNADNALYNYHWFQERAAAIKTADENIFVAQKSLTEFEASAGPRKDWTFEDKNEDGRLRAVVQGNTSFYNGLVNEYDAHAKEVDRNIFQDGLPLFFNLK